MTITINESIVLWVIAGALIAIVVRLTQILKHLDIKSRENFLAKREEKDFSDSFIASDDYLSAKDYIISTGKANISTLQFAFRWSYDKTARIMNELESTGIVGPPRPDEKYREVLVTSENGDDAFACDDDYQCAKDYVVSTGKASTSSLQTAFRWGYNKGARIISQLESEKVIGPARPGERYREILQTVEEGE
jgi:DNA segregation ATPase FtsK/SpoIIIE-like protein